jgi:hypothetical protein
LPALHTLDISRNRIATAADGDALCAWARVASPASLRVLRLAGNALCRTDPYA